ncbi:hypothetical protein HZS_470, partial [Henneguya salminicola]
MRFFKKVKEYQHNENRNIEVLSVNDSEFCNNCISTSRYSLLTFFPLFLYWQFNKLANLYFLIICILQQIPGVSPVGKLITPIPLSIVLLISLVNEILEDIKRRKSDSKINNLKCEIFSRCWRRSTWGEIRVGDIVRVSSGQTFPADLLIIAT